MLTTRFSVVPMSMANGAGVTRSKRTRVPFAVTVNTSAPLPPLTSAVSMPAPPSMQVGVVARIPDHAVVAGLAEHLVVGVAAGQHVVAGAAEQQVVAALAEQRVVAGLAEQHGRRPSRRSARRCRRRRTGWRAAARRSTSSSVMTSLPARPNTWISAGVGDRRRAAGDRHGAAVDQDLAGRVAADRRALLALASPNTRQHAGAG